MTNYMPEDEIIRKAAKAFARYDKFKAQQRELDEELRGLCRDYGVVMKVWGWQPYMLRQAVEARMKKRA